MDEVMKWADMVKDLAAQLRAEVKACTFCDSDGWCEPLGPYRDGSYCSSRPCPNGCADKIADAIRYESGKW